MTVQTIIISGATGGIGLATVKALAADGHRVTGFGRSAEKVATLRPQLQAEFGAEQVELHSLDVRDLPEVKRLVDATAERWGRIDGLVNAAGLLQLEKSHKVAEDSFDLQFDTLFKGSFFTIQAVLPHLLAQRCGLVVNLGSVSGLRAAPQMAVYGAAKAALQHLTASLAAEYAPKGIRFLCVNPGPVRTGLLEPVLFDLLAKQVPLQRLGAPEEVAGLIRYLFSDAARFMTGAALTIDGGAAL